MAKQEVDIGVEGNDGTGDSIRESFRKVNENFSELYAVFGIGGQISFTDLNDVPNTYEGNENKLAVVKSDGSGINFLDLASNNDLDGSTDSISFDFSVDGKLIVQIANARVEEDPEPSLGGPLNAATQPIANITVSQSAVDTFNSVHDTDFSLQDLVINKGFADANYQTKDVPGGGIRLGDEPESTDQYTLTVDEITFEGRLEINDHGLTEAFNGTAFVWNSTISDPFGVTTGESYFVRYVDVNTLSLHETVEGAQNNSARILLAGGSGVFTITDAAYDPTLEGNWLDNIALPRKSIVRRQGDSMEGLLNLSDHPGELAGSGLPNGPDDLQAVTKLYVDSAATTSTVNLYVSTDGDDRQTNTPVGKEGRNQAYAYKTIGAAARKAEEIITSAPFEPGPYRQTITYANGESNSITDVAGISSPVAGRNNASTLILENKEFISKEVTAYVNATFPDFADTYNIETCQRDVGYILDSVRIDSLLGDSANYLSRWAGIRYYSNPSAQRAIGAQRTETIAGIEYARDIVRDYILTNTPVPTQYQDRVEQYIEPLQTPDVNADEVIESKFDIILDIINNGINNLDLVIPVSDGQTNYELQITNGGLGNVDQADPENTDIIPGKVIMGKSSGAIGRIIEYAPAGGVGVDTVEVQLLKPIEFDVGEELEYGNIVRETQITIFAEAGIYEEDYPIKISNNVSLKGDEMRRTIVRPKKRVSQSPYAGSFFYRDAEFDNLLLGKSNIETIDFSSQRDANRVAGTYTIDTFTTNGLGNGAEFEVVVDSFGAVGSITVTKNGKDFKVGDTINIDDSDLGDGGAASVQLTVDSVPNGIEYRNPLNNAVDGYFGYHYLTDPAKKKEINAAAGLRNVGNWETAALTLIDNREFIQEQVVNYIETTYPALIGNYSRAKCSRDAGLIVDALVKDLRNGGAEFSIEAQGEYYAGAVEAGTEAETVDGIQHIYTVASSLIQGTSPSNLYGPNGDPAVEVGQTGENLLYAADLFNGISEPSNWESGRLYRVGNVVRAVDGAVVRYWQVRKENVSGSTFNSSEQIAYWTEIAGPDENIQNLIDIVKFAFDEDYNPPLRNDEMDVFLMNDATIVRNCTIQGHGGFMCVLDPEGQILTKSPYIQNGTAFAKSVNRQHFAGGMFIDAFVGNSAVRVTSRVDGSPFKLTVQSLGDQDNPQGLFVRRPEVPCPFYVDGRRFQVNAVTNYDPDQGTATLILDPSSNDGVGFAGVTSKLSTGVNLDALGTFEFDSIKCDRDARLIIEAASYDTALGTNYNSVTAGLAYQRANAYVVQDVQQSQTTAAILVARDEALLLDSVDADPTATGRIEAAFNEVVDIIENGVVSTETAADALTFDIPSVLPTTAADHAYSRLQNNRTWFGEQLVAYVNANTPPAGYDQVKCARDARYIIDALTYDVLYGGNSATIGAARAYFVGTELDQLPAAQQESTADAYAYLATIVSNILQGVSVANLSGNTETLDLTGTDAGVNEAAVTTDNLSIIEDVVRFGTLNALPSVTDYPSITWATTALQNAFSELQRETAAIARIAVQSVPSPIPVTLQTAGNRSMLGNDFTQVNDLGYGLVVVNGALSEMVSMFTYYCWTSYYSKNGAEIRSVTGSTCYGEFGLVAEGSDPNEIPDRISLYEDMTQPAKAFNVEVILRTTGTLGVVEGETLTQAGTLAEGTVVYGGNLNTIYLTDITGAFDTSNELTGSTSGALGANSVPLVADGTGYNNPVESLSLYAFDFKDVPSNRSEFDVYHPSRPAFARYEVANVTDTGLLVGSYNNVGTDIAYTYVAGVDAVPGATGAKFNIFKSVTDGYTAEITAAGTDYRVGDSFTVAGTLLGGATPANDATITVEEVDDGVASQGLITGVSIAGTILEDDYTPYVNGKVYKLNFSTGDSEFSQNGLLEVVPQNTFINYRRNQTQILTDLARPDVLTIRPSTAVVFDENPGYIYRSISFLTSDSLGGELPSNTSQAGFDTTYDYIRLLIDSAKAQEAASIVVDEDSTPLTATGTKGSTAGDTVIALLPTNDENEIFRLNNNLRTPAANRPLGWTTDTLVEAPIIVWGGKKHYVFNARGVDANDQVVPIAEDNEYVIVEISDVETIDSGAAASGLNSTLVLGSETITLRAGLKAGARGDVTVNISTCRATGHDFLNVGTGGYNQSNYPNIIFGLPREKDQAKETVERTKGRVFYVSTDQDGIFRVGRFFAVDQGTGTVTFSASLALSDVDGLGFKRGVVITEFSTDTAMTDNAADTVPTELAVRGYVNRRLGYDVNGQPVSNKLGPGVLAPNGAVPMTDDLNAAGNTIVNLGSPVNDSDAANKAYVDGSGGDQDEIKDLRSIEYNNYNEGQVIVATGKKKLILAANTIVGGPFEVGDVITGSITGATGLVVDYKDGFEGIEGDIAELTYTPTAGTFSDGKPVGDSPDADTITVVGGAEARVVDGPIDEWANGIANPASDISLLVSRNTTTSGSEVTSRETTLNFQINANTIVNSDIAAGAQIAQSKLNMNAAGTISSADGISQSDLGLAAFDSSVFTNTNGWVSIENGQLPLEKIQRIQDGNVLGNWSGDSSDNDIDQITFGTVVREGGGLEDSDFVSVLTAATDPGEALIKTGAGTYALSNVTNSGENNSILKTDVDGSIQVNSLILGGNDTYEVLSLDTLDLVMKTPAQGEILRAVGTTGGSPNGPDLEVKGSLNIGNAGVTESVLHSQSGYTGESSLAADWIYSNFIEATGEKTAATTGIAIGADTGKTLAGEVGIVTADSATSSSFVPFIFSSTGVKPDTDDTYDIGTATAKYANVYATLFRGTATESYYADLAENYLGDADYEPGTVLVFGGDAEVTTTSTKGDHRVAGVVTTNPAHLMNSHLEGDNIIGVALTGRVPCKVIGRVAKGDILIASAVPGYAMVNNTPNVGTIIGKALESKDTADKGVVEVVVGKH